MTNTYYDIIYGDIFEFYLLPSLQSSSQLHSVMGRAVCKTWYNKCVVPRMLVKTIQDSTLLKTVAVEHVVAQLQKGESWDDFIEKFKEFHLPALKILEIVSASLKIDDLVQILTKVTHNIQEIKLQNVNLVGNEIEGEILSSLRNLTVTSNATSTHAPLLRWLSLSGQLEHIELKSTRTKDAFPLEILIESISRCRNLRTLRLTLPLFDPEMIAHLIIAINSSCPDLRELRLPPQWKTANDKMSLLAETFVESKLALRTMALGTTGFVSEHIEYWKKLIESQVASSQMLQTFSCPFFGSELLEFVLDCAHRAPKVHSLQLGSNELDDRTSRKLYEILHSQSAKIHTLDLQFARFSIDGFATFSKTIAETTSLTWLRTTSLDEDEMSELASALAKNRSLKFLNVSSGNFGNDGMLALCQALESHPSLTHLSLADSDVGDEGFLAISNLIKMNRTILHLDLAYLALETSLDEVVAALRNNTSLKTLDISCAGLNIGQISEIADAFSDRPPEAGLFEKLIVAPNKIDGSDKRQLITKYRFVSSYK